MSAVEASRPRVSVVIPTHNRSGGVCRAIDSALAQTLPPHELIVVDDASTDDTVAELRQQYGDRIVIVALKRNVGGAGARNVGADRATGEFVAFLDSDDVWYPDKLERQAATYAAAVREGGDVFVYARGDLEYLVRGDAFSPQRALRADEPVDEYIFIEQQDVQTSGFYMTRELFQRVRFSDGLRRHQDIDFAIRLQGLGARFVLTEGTIYKRFNDVAGGHVGTMKNDDVSIVWARKMRPSMTPRAYNHFLVRRVMPVVFTRRPLLCTGWVLRALVSGQPALDAYARVWINALRLNRLLPMRETA